MKLRSSTYFLQHKLASVEGLDEKTMTVDPENLVEILLENWVRHFFFFFFPLPRLFSRTSAALTFKTAFSLTLSLSLSLSLSLFLSVLTSSSPDSLAARWNNVRYHGDHILSSPDELGVENSATCNIQSRVSDFTPSTSSFSAF